MTAIAHNPESVEIVKASLSLFQHDTAATIKLSDKSPLPLSLCAQNHSGDQGPILNVRLIKHIDHHAGYSDENSPPESIQITENILNKELDSDNTSNSEDDREADNDSDMEMDNGSEDSETLKQQNDSAAPNTSG
jgi:hypothetical protein